MNDVIDKESKGFRCIYNNIIKKIKKTNDLVVECEQVSTNLIPISSIPVMSMEEYKKLVDNHEHYIRDEKRNLAILNTNRVAVMKLMTIEEYLLSNLWQYPLTYVDPDVNRGCFSPMLNMKLLLKSELTSCISIAVPLDSFTLESTKVTWTMFAELMININNIYYTRRDFGLTGYHNKYDIKDPDDEVFVIYNFKELQQILQKLDTWYGTTLD